MWLALRLAQRVVDTFPRSAIWLERLLERVAFGLRILISRGGQRTVGGGLNGFISGLIGSSDPISRISVLHLLGRNGLLSDGQFNHFLSTSLNARELQLMDEVLADPSLGSPELKLLFSARLALFRGLPFDGTKMEPLLQSNNRFLPRLTVMNTMIEALVRAGNIDALTSLFQSKGSLVLTTAREPSILGVVRLLMTRRELQPIARKILIEFLERINIRRRFYFLEVCYELIPEKLSHFCIPQRTSWRSVLEEFRIKGSGAPRWNEFDAQCLQPLKRIPSGDQDLMDVRIDAMSAKKLFCHLLAHVEQQRPCSFIRLGDGESYAYPQLGASLGGNEAFILDCEKRERTWWRCNLDEVRREEIQSAVRGAVMGADILGVPSIYRLIRDFAAEGILVESAAQRGLAIILSAIGGEIPIGQRIFTEERAHQVVLTSDNIRALIAHAKRTVIVSCWSADQLADLGNNFSVVQIAPHSKVAHASSANLESLPFNYNSVLREIDETVRLGDLVLVGAGVIGKIFISAARAKGAIALDVGAMLDYVAGYKTRSIADII